MNRVHRSRDVLHILHVTQAIGGGVPQAIADHIRATPGFDHHILWAPANNPRVDGLKVSINVMPEGKPRQWFTTRRVVRELKPDVLVAHSSWAGLYARLPQSRVPTVYQPHAFVMEDPWRPASLRLAFHLAETLMSRRTSALVALTEREVEIASNLGVKDIRFVPNTSHAFSNTAKAHPPTVVMAGRICAMKDPIFFLEVANRVRARRPDVGFVWVGDGDEVTRDALTNAGVTVTGWVDQDIAWDHIASASVYAHTASYEGFPLTVLDAARLGRPMVLRDIAPFQRIDTLRVKSPEQMSDAVLAILEDPAAEAHAVAASRTLTDSTTPQIQAKQLESLYRDMAALKGAP